MSTHTLGTPKPGNYDPTLVDRLNKAAEEEARRLGEQAKQKYGKRTKPKPADEQPSMFSITSLLDYFVVSGVRYRNAICRVDLHRELLQPDGGEDWDKRWQLHPRHDNAASLPMYHALFRELYAHKDEEAYAETVEKARSCIEDMLKQRVVTLAKMQPKALIPGVHHCCSIARSWLRAAQLTSRKPCAIDKLSGTDVYTLFGRDNAATTQDVYNWLTRSSRTKVFLPNTVASGYVTLEHTAGPEFKAPHLSIDMCSGLWLPAIGLRVEVIKKIEDEKQP